MVEAASVTRLLRRYPWADHAFLSSVLPALSRKDLSARDLAALAGVQPVNVPGAGWCFSLDGEPLETLACAWRWRVARSFALKTMGAGAVEAGISPGIWADGEFWWQDRWWRVWADLGSCAPEALPLAVRPPRQYGPGVRDVVVTTRAERLGLLAAQVAEHFRGPSRVTVWLYGSERYLVARPERAARQAWPGYAPAEIEAFLEARTRRARQGNPLCRRAAELSAAAWDLLIHIGNNPLLTREELAFLLAGRVADYEPARARINRLLDMQLLSAAGRDGQARLALTRTALELLALYWGAAPHHLARFLPWPQRVRGGRASYALERLEAIQAHTRLVRQFALALKDGSRRLSNAAGGLDVELITMVGSRVVYREAERQGFDWVAPDAALRVAFWKTVRGEDGRERRAAAQSFTVFLEVDRATNSIPRLARRLDNYARVWASLEGEQQAQLVWVIDGTPWRERKILEAMGARTIRGWTVALDRLILPPADSWWQAHPAGGLSLDDTAVGGMAPLRPVWRSAQSPGMLPFLDCQPWQAGGPVRAEDGGKGGRRS